MNSKNDSGYALSFVLIITFLITTLLLGIITIISFYDLQALKRIKKKKIDLACYSIMQKVLSGDLQINKNGSYVINDIKIHVDYEMKGLFKTFTVSGKNGKDSSKIRYTAANKVSKPLDNALIISRPNLGVTVAGDTKIIGNVLVTKNAFERGSIYGIRNNNDDYLHGKIALNENINQQYFNDSLVLNSIYEEPNYSITVKRINDNYFLNEKSSFLLDSLRTIVINGDLIVQNVSLQLSKEISFFVHGKTIMEDRTISDIGLKIHSDSSIIIGENVSIKNVVFTSKKSIIIAKNSYFKNCQFLSAQNIIISQSKFDYPSNISIYVNTTDQNKLNNKIEIDSSIVNGSILLLCKQTGLSANKSKILISRKSKVQGLIYSESNVEIAGEINGMIYTYNFRYYKEPTEYINWLVNLHLYRNKLNEFYLLPVGFNDQNSLAILSEKWIY